LCLPKFSGSPIFFRHSREGGNPVFEAIGREQDFFRDAALQLQNNHSDFVSSFLKKKSGSPPARG
jgi:hypothetical protein